MLWSEADWSFAIDTALVAAQFHEGQNKADKLMQRERVLGVTMDFRRDLRIRYVDPEPDEKVEDASVTAIASYRAMVSDE